MKYYAEVEGETFEFTFQRRDNRLVATDASGRERVLDRAMVGDGTAFSLIVDGASHDVMVDRDGQGTIVQVAGERLRVAVEDERERAAKAVAGAKGGGRREVRAVMPGVVVEVLVEEGATVAEGETLIVLEAMKMQNPLLAEVAGTVVSLVVKPGQTVAGGDLLAVVEGLTDEVA